MGLDRSVREVLRDRGRVDLLWRVFLETRDARRAGMSSIGRELPERVMRIRERSLANLGELLEELRASVERSGGRLHLVRNGREACEVVHGVLTRRGIRRLMKSKSMTSEEIGLNGYLESRGIEVLETDLGERIVQLARQRPSHLLGPALHLSRQEVSRVLSSWIGRDLGSDPRGVVAAFRDAIRRSVRGFGAGLTGANAIDSETGALVVVTNEGNEQLVIGMAEVVICVAGVEKVVRGIEAAIDQAMLQAFSATGRPPSFLTVYGPWVSAEGKEFHLVLVDNGRLRALGDRRLREGLRCVRCAACYNVCPTYRTVGGHVFGGTYTGPIGVFWEAVTKGPDAANEFSDLCVSCGLCALECPVGIRIPLLISLVKSMRRDHRLRDWLVATGYERFAIIGSRLPGFVNWISRSKTFRALLELVAGVDRSRPLPRFRGGDLHQVLERTDRTAASPLGEVVYFPDTFAQLVDWRIGLGAVELLRTFGYRVIVPRLQGSGMPFVQYGFLRAAASRARFLVDALYPHVESGRVVVTTEPTAAYCLREVYPWLLGDEKSARVASAVRDLIAFLSEHLERSLDPEGPLRGLRAYYHVPCHARGTGAEEVTSRLLGMAGLEVVSEDLGCCGMAGTWGLRSGASRSGLSVEIGRRVAGRIAGHRPDVIVTESSVCSLQLSHLTGLPVLHPVTVMTSSLRSE
ncbi:MAG: LUD domain-containing protein [Nitrososphaerota archaeon]